MHREIGNWARGQAVSQATPFAESELVILEAEEEYSEPICSYYWATRPAAEEQKQTL